MKDLEALCAMAAASDKHYWPFMITHCRLWFILDKLGKV